VTPDAERSVDGESDSELDMLLEEGVKASNARDNKKDNDGGIRRLESRSQPPMD
jgi:hypothetical protein